MTDVFSPASDAEAVDIVRDARAKRRSIAVEGGGTRAGLGRPVAADGRLSTRKLCGITLYEPAELVISARAGTPLAEIEEVLREKKQRLPFEPMDHRALFETGAEPTIGAIAACNISGPRRIQAGAARDHLIGVRMVNGFGEIIKSGGRVMKNVTGLDLVKLNCGAYGTLAVLTEVTFKVLPQPQATATLALHGLDDHMAVAALSAGLTSPFQVTGAAHLPHGIEAPDAAALTLLRLEGAAASVDYRADALTKALASFGKAAILAPERAASLWRVIRDVLPLVAPRDNVLWRISVAPSRGPDVLAAVMQQLAARAYYDWGGGLIWLSAAAQDDAGARAVREALAEACGEGRGHATLIRAADALRTRIDVFQPLAAPLMEITRALKASFDPDHILNPGRMYAGI